MVRGLDATPLAFDPHADFDPTIVADVAIVFIAADAALVSLASEPLASLIGNLDGLHSFCAKRRKAILAISDEILRKNWKGLVQISPTYPVADRDPSSATYSMQRTLSEFPSPSRSDAHHEEGCLGDEHHQLKAGHLSDKIRQASFALLVGEKQRS